MKKFRVIALILCVTMLFAGCDPIPQLQRRQQEVIGGETLEDGRNSGGYVEVALGDTVATAWFNFTIHSIKEAAEYQSYVPGEGYRLLVADISMQNTYPEEIPMFSSDFQIAWGEGEEDYNIPIEAFCELQVADEFSMSKREEVRGDMVFEIPAEEAEFLDISFMEIYSDNEVGITYFVDFTESDITK